MRSTDTQLRKRSVLEGEQWRSRPVYARGGAALGVSVGGHGFGAGPAALGTITNSPVTAWFAGAITEFGPLSEEKIRETRAGIAAVFSPAETFEWWRMVHRTRQSPLREEINRFGGITGELGVACALKMMWDNRIPRSQLPSALLSVGASGEFAANALRALAAQEETRSRKPYGFLPLRKAVAAGYVVRNHVGDIAERAFAAQAVVAADDFARNTGAPLPGAVIDTVFVRRVEQIWDSDRPLRAAVTVNEWNGAGRDTRAYIGYTAARAHLWAARAYYDEPTEVDLHRLTRSTMRLADLDQLNPVQGFVPWEGRDGRRSAPTVAPIDHSSDRMFTMEKCMAISPR